MAGIRESIEKAVQYLSEHPDEAGYTGSFARAWRSRWTASPTTVEVSLEIETA